LSSKRKPVYLLAGGRGKTIFSTFSIVKDILRDTDKSKPVIAYIGVASMADNWLFFLMIAVLIKAKCNCRIIRIKIAARNADLERAKKIIEQADAVFFSGGDVEAGMQILEEKGMTGYWRDIADDGKLLFGISAGSIMMSGTWVRWRDPNNDTTAETFTCLGLTPIICDTHAEKDGWAELKTALKLEKPGMTGYGLTSGSCLKVYPDGRVEARCGSIARYAMINGQIEKQADLVPPKEKS
jgi:peptidase E